MDTETIKTCKEHRRLARRLERDLAGWLLKHPEATVPQATDCVICEAR